ncbi:MAG TPA: hypothetical protein VF506_17970 [Streptosporangiaceae bacterium]
MKTWWLWIKDKASHSYAVAYLLGMVSAHSIVVATTEYRNFGVQYFLDLLTAVVTAKFALVVWRRADERAGQRKLRAHDARMSA